MLYLLDANVLITANNLRWEIDQAAHCRGRCEGFTPVDGCFKGAYLGAYG